jgi:triosephosphate isomerase
MKPVIIINFKSYGESVGKDAVHLAKICQEVADKTGSNIMIAVQPADIYPVTCSVKIPVLAQHVDCQYGKFTGSSVAKSVKDAGAYGTLLNHAERKIPAEVLKRSVEECKRVGLKIVVCAADMKESKEALETEPEFIAYEIPELIGTGKSITSAKPESVREFSCMLHGTLTLPLCGAGVSSNEDLAGAVELGAKGVLLASGITQAKDPKKALLELIGHN